MVLKERENLPYRKNTEGYFIDNKGNILSKDSKQSYIIFPGGGINEGETPEQAVLRETFEETGAIIENLRLLGKLVLPYSKNWAKTQKQKSRYEKFQGDEMYFFAGNIKEFRENKKEEDSWHGEKLMPVEKVIKILTLLKKDKYKKAQLKYLKELFSSCKIFIS